MRYQNGRVEDIRIAYVGGGSRGWAWGLMADLALEGQLGGTVALYDIDRQAAEDNAWIGNGLAQRPEAVGKWHYEVADSLREALTGADFAILSILPGTFDEMESDVHAPEAYGIYQSVGDTVGPGGLLRAMRTVPMYVEIASAIRDYAPEAFVINYTNPMTLCVRTLYEVFPQIRAFGCCHEVFGTQKLLAEMVKEMLDVGEVDRQEIHVNVMGINHFTWLDRASYQGFDLMPLYTQFARKYAQTGYTQEKEDHWMNSSFHCAHRVKFDLFLRYGLIAAAGDRHLAEFVPPWYLKDPQTVKQWCFGLTSVAWRREDLQRRLNKSRAYRSGEVQVDLSGSGEEGVLQIKALLGLGQMVTNVNLPNRGQIPNLPRGAVVETNALLGRDGPLPVVAGDLPPGVLALVRRQVDNQEAALEAILRRDTRLAFAVFMNDPLMTLDVDAGRALFRQMMRNTQSYLPGWDLDFA